MRILVVASFNRGRFAPFIVEQVEALKNAGCEIDCFGLQGKGIKGYLGNLPLLKGRIKEFRPDVVHAHYGLSGLFANLQRQVPVVTTYHGSDINEKNVLRFSKMAMWLSAWSIFVSQKTKDIASPKGKYTLLPCGVDLSDLQLTEKQEARKKLGMEMNKKYVLFSGAFDNSVKNAPLAKEVVSLLHNDNVELLELKGYSREEVTLLMCASDAFLMTSFTEGSPQVIKEAMACGCPIVSVDVGDVRERTGGVNGCFVAKTRDPQELAELLQQAMLFQGKTQGRERLLSDGLENENVVRQLMEIYERVVKKMNIIEGKHIDSTAWENLVKTSPVATWFQTPDAYAFFDGLSFVEAFAYAIASDGLLKGVVVGYIQKDGGKLKRFFSRRAIVLGGPLLDDNITDEELTFLLHSMKDCVGRKAIFIETRNFNDYSHWRTTFEHCGFRYQPHYDIHVDTTSMELVNSKLDRNRKRNIKKALDHGAVIDENPSVDDIHRLYSMLEELYITKVKTPLFPFEFFEKLGKHSSSRFFLAKNAEGYLLGGMVCVVLDNRAVYAWLACGDDFNYKALSPSVMVNYAGISYAAREGVPRFDFMGAGKPDDGGYGVRDFKLKFGGDLVEYGRFVYVCNPLLFGIGRLAVRIIKKT